MTVYVSRNATAGEPPQNLATVAPPAVRRGPVDPPLLTYVWRIVFKRQAREHGGR